METSTKITAIFNCSIERAFKTPILCDITKVHTGYGLMPRVTHCTEDKGWGQIGSSKQVLENVRQITIKEEPYQYE